MSWVALFYTTFMYVIYICSFSFKIHKMEKKKSKKSNKSSCKTPHLWQSSEYASNSVLWSKTLKNSNPFAIKLHRPISATLLKMMYLSKFWNITAAFISVNMQYEEAWKLTQNPQNTAISWVWVPLACF